MALKHVLNLKLNIIVQLPTGYIKCGFMNYRVRDDRRDTCTKFQKKKVFNQSIIKMDFVKKKMQDLLIK